MDAEIISFYERGLEAARLERGPGRLELARTQELLGRYLPPAPAVVLDVGGGTGAYSRWLASLGYAAHLIDPVPLHLEQARAAEGPARIATIELGDARKLAWEDASVDAVLLCGPLYHLTSREDRLKALSEARRVTRPGGVICAAAISRFSPVFSGLWRKMLDERAARDLVEGVLADGSHLNPTRHPDYFTTAFFHHPDELKREVEGATLKLEGLFGVEGPAWLLPDLDFYWNFPERRAQLMGILRSVESDPSLLGLSAHLLAVVRR